MVSILFDSITKHFFDTLQSFTFLLVKPIKVDHQNDHINAFARKLVSFHMSGISKDSSIHHIFGKHARESLNLQLC